MNLIKRLPRQLKTIRLYLAVGFLTAVLCSLAGAAETQSLPADQIEMEARRYLESQLAWAPQELEISVKWDGKSLALPAGHVNLDFERVGARNALGRVSLSMLVRVDGKVHQKVWLNANVEGWFEIVQAARPIPRNHVINTDDIQLVRIKSSRPLRQVVLDPADVIGYQAVRDLDFGQSISPYMVKAVPLLNRGDRILLVAENGSLRITAPGVVKEKGFKDKMVQVENLQTKKVIYGTVIDSKTVKVEF